MRRRGLILGLLFCGMAVAAAAQGVDEVLMASFDDVVAPALPPGWEVTEEAWETSTSVTSPGSGGNNLYARGSAAGTLTLPPVNLAGAMSAELTYLARRIGSYDAANMRISASIDGGATYPIEVAAAGAALPEEGSSYETVVLPLPAALLDHAEVRLRIETLGLSSASANVRLDDFRITATRLVIVRPATLHFVAIPGSSQTQTVEVTNTDAAPLQVNPPFVGGGAFSVVPSTAVLIPPGETQTYAVTWSPVVHGPEARTLLLVHEHGSSSVGLAGETAGGIFGFMADSSTVVAGAAVE